MRKLLLTITAFLFSFLMQAQQMPAFPAGTEAFYNKAMKAINTRHVAWIKSTAKKTNANTWTEADVKKETTNYAVLGNMSDMDIEALVLLIMMELSRSAQEDLKAMMEQVKSNMEKKEKMRDMLKKVKESRTVTYQKFDSIRLLLDQYHDLKEKRTITKRTIKPNKALKPLSLAEMDALIDEMMMSLNSMGELQEEISLKLKMALDRMNKMMRILANMMKKISDTQDAIIANLK